MAARRRCNRRPPPTEKAMMPRGYRLDAVLAGSSTPAGRGELLARSRDRWKGRSHPTRRWHISGQAPKIGLGVFCDVRQHTLTFALFLNTAPGRLHIGCCACPPRAESLETM